MDKQELKFIYGLDGKQTFGSGGFLFLDDVMGDDKDIARIARVSYGEGTKTVSDDTSLIRRLIKDNHSSPLAHQMIRGFIRAPLYVVAQLKTHRTFQWAQWNQMSLRYSLAITEMETVQPDQWRTQSSANKQGSDGFVKQWPATGPHAELLGSSVMPPGEYLTMNQLDLQNLSRQIYQERIDLGVSREQARMDLPCSNYTELYFTVDLHNLLHFLSLRLDPHAQQEIRELAQCLDNIVKDWVPITWQAFQDYRMNAITFSSQEIQVLRSLILEDHTVSDWLLGPQEERASSMKTFGITSLNERASFVDKVRRLIG